MQNKNRHSNHWTALCYAILTILCSHAHAATGMDADTVRKLSAIKSIAFSPTPISPQQVARALAVELQTECSSFDDPTVGKYRLCTSSPAEDDRETPQLAFLHYSTVNRGAEHDTGGTVHFATKNDTICLSEKDLSKFFQVVATPSSERVLTEPTLPYIPARRYNFNFPKQGKFDVTIHVLESGHCASLIELGKTSYKPQTGK